jgi:hypothetical protein
MKRTTTQTPPTRAKAVHISFPLRAFASLQCYLLKSLVSAKTFHAPPFKFLDVLNLSDHQKRAFRPFVIGHFVIPLSFVPLSFVVLSQPSSFGCSSAALSLCVKKSRPNHPKTPAISTFQSRPPQKPTEIPTFPIHTLKNPCNFNIRSHKISNGLCRSQFQIQNSQFSIK